MRPLSSRHWQSFCRKRVSAHPGVLSLTSSSFPNEDANYSKNTCRSLSASSTTTRPFDKVLIANRGEIACRVIRTCRRMGIETVALYSSGDGPNALHASMADEAYCIGTGPSATDSYLLGNDVIDIARQSGAQAIHPGYGFLSENANFCENAVDASIAFVGPGPKAINAMGSKSESKSLVESTGVPTTPGYHGLNQDPEYLLHEAVTNVGFPLLIKVVMGGGGKGMRLVWKDSDFLEALESCKRESQSAFGDASVLLEKYLVAPRHVEVQIVADNHGNVVHLYERDCSLQRRHQKVIEEAPASDLPQDLRNKFGEMGKRAAQAVGYVNAGTVEFLLDTQQDSGEFYFCEMNTRLQVEHPITELITGVDLVEWQLRIAAGEELPVKDQSDIQCNGHSMEARIYAENPANDFLPATGNIWYHSPPANPNVGADDNGIRVDTGIKSGQTISINYDPMISKLIVHGKDRKAALNKLIAALKHYQIAGIPTNIDFLVQCAQHPTFGIAGAVNTGFLDDHGDEINLSIEKQSSTAQAIGAFATILHLENRIGITDFDAAKRASSPWSHIQGTWRMGGKGGRVKRLLTFAEGFDHGIEYWSNRDGSIDIGVPSKAEDKDGGDDRRFIDWFNIDGALDSEHRMSVSINGVKQLNLTTVLQEKENGEIRVRVWNPNVNEEEYTWEVAFRNPLVPMRGSLGEGTCTASHGVVKAPMPGKIVRVNISVGDTVSAGEVLLVMEAMKMEHAIKSPREGVVADISYAVGDVVKDGSVLAELEVEANQEIAG
eukprot:CAMPEP_0195289268 /NCGR_PEP_ID=MMETSP0707-20130614/5617_1 /TAXON_ID=33640 /ORGANISM="Asterionellopsis glacialis, Strain CCMP134" /LENGTH=776 /DNA_ID=CAMNT_0040349255 /DNA_START=36 /DNA_END=2366 /DNA_ORIENTATION=+